MACNESVYNNDHRSKGFVNLNRVICNFMILPVDLELYAFDLLLLKYLADIPTLH